MLHVVLKSLDGRVVAWFNAYNAPLPGENILVGGVLYRAQTRSWDFHPNVTNGLTLNIVVTLC